MNTSVVRDFGLRLLSHFVPFALAIVVQAGGAEVPCVWSNVERIVAVGDIHGDYGRLVEVLQAAGLIDKTNGWCGGKAHLVQMGDVLDRGPDSRRAMDLLMILEKQAAAAGGAVHALIGNHEAMVLSGDYSYVHPGEIEAFGDLENFRKAFAPDGEYGRWILSHNGVIRINDIIFAHGGLPPSVRPISLLEINQMIRRDLADPQDGNPEVMDSRSPLWYRGLALMADDEQSSENMDRFLKLSGASRIVIGHTVSKGGIGLRANGRVLMVDVGLSRYYVNGPAVALVIEKGKFYEVGSCVRRELPVSSRRDARRIQIETTGGKAEGHGGNE
ncbi:MAG: metallophosphoesterase [Kiritimatiellia bacterium]